MKEKITVIGGILAIIGVIFTAYFWIDGRYALSQELEKTKARLEYKILSDQFQAISDRIWKIKDRAGEKPKDPTVKEELRQLESDKESVKVKIDAMEKK